VVARACGAGRGAAVRYGNRLTGTGGGGARRPTERRGGASSRECVRCDDLLRCRDGLRMACRAAASARAGLLLLVRRWRAAPPALRFGGSLRSPCIAMQVRHRFSECCINRCSRVVRRIGPDAAGHEAAQRGGRVERVRAFKAMDVIELNARTDRPAGVYRPGLIPFCGIAIKSKCLYRNDIFKRYVARMRIA
jgi:hypothetical protein